MSKTPSKPKPRKLQINKSQIRKLDSADLGAAAGGKCANTADTGFPICKCCVGGTKDNGNP